LDYSENTDKTEEGLYLMVSIRAMQERDHICQWQVDRGDPGYAGKILRRGF
jgi:hypothetical protein